MGLKVSSIRCGGSYMFCKALEMRIVNKSRTSHLNMEISLHIRTERLGEVWGMQNLPRSIGVRDDR